MSEVDGRGTTVMADGVAVEKAYEFDQFPVSAVMLVVRSQQTEPVTVRITDPLPDGVETEDVGLHSAYGEEYATVGDDVVKIAFDLDPEDTETIVYGLRDVDPAELDGRPPDPRVNAVAIEPESDDTSEIVRDVIAGEPEDDSEETSDAEEPAKEDVEPLDLPDPTESSAVDETGEQADEPTDAATVAETEPVESHVAALARELRTGGADEADIAIIRDAIEPETGGSTEARIQDLQTEMADLRAYTDALESFLDENGTAQALLEDLQTDIADVTDELATVQTEIATLEETVDAVEETSIDLEDGLESTQTDLEALDERIDEEIAPDLEALRDAESDESLVDRLDTLEATVDELAAEMEEVLDVQERLQSVFGTESDE